MDQFNSGLLDAIQPENTPASGASSEREWEFWAKREEAIREQDKLQAAHEQDKESKHWIHKIILFNIKIAGLCIAACFIIRTLHLLLPLGVMWLNNDQLSTIDNLAKLVTTGALGSLLTRYLNKSFDNGNPNGKAP